MPAIVLDQKQANEQPGGERRERKRQPEQAVARGQQHRGPTATKGGKVTMSSKIAASRTRLTVAPSAFAQSRADHIALFVSAANIQHLARYAL